MDPEACLMTVYSRIKRTEWGTYYEESRHDLADFYRWVSCGGFHTPMMMALANYMTYDIRQQCREQWKIDHIKYDHEKMENYVAELMKEIDILRSFCRD